MWTAFLGRLSGWPDIILLFGINLILQSTLIILIGLAGVHVLRMRRKGAAAQSLMLRTCLAGVLLALPVLLTFSALGIKGLHISVPLRKASVVSMSSESLPRHTSSAPISDRPGAVILSEKPTAVPTPEKARSAVTPTATPASPLPAREPEQLSRIPGNTHPLANGNLPESSKSRPLPQGIPRGISILFTLVWAAFALFLTLRTVAITLYIRRIHRLSSPVLPQYAAVCRAAARQLGISAPPILQSPYVTSTLLTGLLHPTILLPLGGNEDSMATREIFLHELAHLARRDPLWLHLCQLAKILLPLQPLLWVLARHIEELSDYACDDYVIRHTGGNRTYAAQLFNLARSFHPGGIETAAGAGIFSTRFPLLRRIEHILDNSYSRHITVSANEVMSFTIVFLCAVTLSGLIGFRGKSYGQMQKFSQALSRGGMPVALAALTLVKEQVTEKLQPSEPAASSDSRKETPAHAVEAVPPEDRSATALLAVSNLPAQNNAIPESAIILSESGPNTANSPDYMARNTVEISPALNTSANSFDSASSGRSIEKSSKRASADSLWRRGLPENSVKALLPKVNTDYTSAAIAVLIPYNYKDADKTNPEEKRWSDIYEAADRNQINPIWSPDGTKIAFSDMNYCIWMAPSGGGELTLVYDNYHKARYGNYDLQLSGLKPMGFSPGGHEITFAMEMISEEHGTRVDIWASPSYTYYRILKAYPVIAGVNIDSGEKRIIAEDTRSGSWSHDGRYFVYQRDSIPELHIRDMRSGTDRTVLNGISLSPCFTPSDRYIVFSQAASDGSTQIFRLPVSGGTPEQLTFLNPGDPVESRFITDCSPNGEWILFTGLTAERSTLGVINTVTGSLHDLFPNGTFLLSSGKFSVDSKKICYSLSAGDADGPIQKLFTCNFSLPSEATPAQVQEKGGAPSSFTLTGNYPNPFNMSTTIQFALPSTGFVRLTIYNVMGQKVRELVARELAPGTHSIVWNGNDERGNGVSTGVYITHLQWNNHIATRRITLVK